MKIYSNLSNLSNEFQSLLKEISDTIDSMIVTSKSTSKYIGVVIIAVKSIMNPFFT